MTPTFDDVLDAARVLKGDANRTRTVTSRTVDAITGAQVFFKDETQQRVGAF